MMEFALFAGSALDAKPLPGLGLGLKKAPLKKLISLAQYGRSSADIVSSVTASASAPSTRIASGTGTGSGTDRY